VKIQAATAVGTAGRVGAATGRHRFHTVNTHTGEFRAQTTYRDIAAFTGHTVNSNAGNALQRFGQVGIREVGDIFGDDGVYGAGSFAFLIQSGCQGAPKAGHYYRSEEHTSELQSRENLV